MEKTSLVQQALDQGKGILRLSPTWVPRSFCIPGRRIKLHQDDYYALGGIRGGIDERWLSSTTPADNGPLTSKNEGLSHIVFEDGNRQPKLFCARLSANWEALSSGHGYGINIRHGRCTPNFLIILALCRTTFITGMNMRN